MNGCLPFKLIFRLLKKVKIDHVQSRTLRISGHSNITLIDHALVLENSAGFHVGWSAVVCVCASCWVVSDSLRPHVLVCQAPLRMEFSRREYWSGLPFPSPGDLPDPGYQTQVIAGRFFTIWATRKAHRLCCLFTISLPSLPLVEFPMHGILPHHTGFWLGLRTCSDKWKVLGW